jgi:nucleoside-diphosphate-sugar epimerase
MAIFITGAGGFLGQALINTLLEQGKEVLAFDYAKPKDEILAKWAGKVKFYQGDIRDSKLINELTAESGTSDPIIHLAGILTAACDREPRSAMDIKTGGTCNVLEAA